MFVNFFEKFRLCNNEKVLFCGESCLQEKAWERGRVAQTYVQYNILHGLQTFVFKLYSFSAFVLHCTALHCTALHCTALHCTALHCTGLVFILEFLTHSIVSGCPNRLLPNYRGSEVPTI
jgi:hypothetical protein